MDLYLVRVGHWCDKKYLKEYMVTMLKFTIPTSFRKRFRMTKAKKSDHMSLKLD